MGPPLPCIKHLCGARAPEIIYYPVGGESQSSRVHELPEDHGGKQSVQCRTSFTNPLLSPPMGNRH